MLCSWRNASTHEASPDLGQMQKSAKRPCPAAGQRTEQCSQRPTPRPDRIRRPSTWSSRPCAEPEPCGSRRPGSWASADVSGNAHPPGLERTAVPECAQSLRAAVHDPVGAVVELARDPRTARARAIDAGCAGSLTPGRPANYQAAARQARALLAITNPPSLHAAARAAGQRRACGETRNADLEEAPTPAGLGGGWSLLLDDASYGLGVHLQGGGRQAGQAHLGHRAVLRDADRRQRVQLEKVIARSERRAADHARGTG